MKLEKGLLSMHGVLLPANEKNPSNLCTPAEDQLAIYMENYAVETAEFPLTLIEINEKPTVVIDRLANGSVAISLDVLSEDKKIVARLSKNEFTVNSNNVLSMERKDRSGLKVLDQYGHEVLNVRDVNRRAVTLDAELHSEGRTVSLHGLPISGICIDIEKGRKPRSIFAIN